ncbi:MAG: LytTR family DNA-binding domain-containing protein [Bacteroidota bacterium]
MPVAITTHYRDHLLIGFALGLWLYLFLAIIGPFDAAPLALWVRMIIMVGYGLVFFLMYLTCIPLQNWWYQSAQHWNWAREVALLAWFCFITLPASYRYYITEIVNGDWGFTRFALEIYLPTLVVIIPVLTVIRWLVARWRQEKIASERREESPQVLLQLQGENRHDILQLPAKDLLALSAANNYVMVYYLEDQDVQKKLLRTTLKKLQNTMPELVQIHRSHLVNPIHFRKWKDTGTLLIGSIELPVSKTFKTRLEANGIFVPK